MTTTPVCRVVMPWGTRCGGRESQPIHHDGQTDGYHPFEPEERNATPSLEDYASHQSWPLLGQRRRMVSDELLVRLDGPSLAALRSLIEKELGRRTKLSAASFADIGPVAYIEADNATPPAEEKS